MWATTGFLVLSFVMMVSSQQTCSQGVNSRCERTGRRGLNSTQQTTLLNEHNRLRNQVAAGNEKRGSPGPQPKASDMRKMIWDQQVADAAQRWADQCMWGHGFCSTDPRFSKGQNLYAMMSSSSASQINLISAVQSWYNEVTTFPNSSVNPFKYKSEAGHYTQLAWANSYVLGCGFIQYYVSSSNLYWNTLVCDYAPAGNVIGGKMYTPGSPCTACQTTAKKCDTTYTSLCV